MTQGESSGQGGTTPAQRVSARGAEEGLIVSTGRTQRVVVARDRYLYVRVPRSSLGEDGCLSMHGGSSPMTLRAGDATPQKHDRLLFRLPIRKGERYSVWIQGPLGRRQLLAGGFDAAIDEAVAHPKKQALAGRDVVFPEPRAGRARGQKRARVAAGRPCPECGAEDDE